MFDIYSGFPAPTNDPDNPNYTDVPPLDFSTIPPDSHQEFDGAQWVIVPNNPPATISAIDFKMAFTAQERVAIKQSTDPIVQDFFELLNDPRVESVDLSKPSVQDALNYLEANSLIGAGRADEIIATKAD